MFKTENSSRTICLCFAGLLASVACEQKQTALQRQLLPLIGDSLYVELPPESTSSSSDYVFKLNQLERFYAVPGEFGYDLHGHKYGFSSLSLILTETHPGGGPPLHVHESEEAHVLFDGTVTYVIGDTTFTVSGPYVAKAPASVPHAFINAGSKTFNLVAVFPSDHITFKEIGPNPLITSKK